MRTVKGLYVTPQPTSPMSKYSCSNSSIATQDTQDLTLSRLTAEFPLSASFTTLQHPSLSFTESDILREEEEEDYNSECSESSDYNRILDVTADDNDWNVSQINTNTSFAPLGEEEEAQHPQPCQETRGSPKEDESFISVQSTTTRRGCNRQRRQSRGRRSSRSQSSRIVSPPPSPDRSAWSADVTTRANNRSLCNGQCSSLLLPAAQRNDQEQQHTYNEPSTAVIRVGGQDFVCSTALLSYASPVLADCVREKQQQEEKNLQMQSNGATTTNTSFLLLDIPHKAAAEWQALQVFLKPRSVQAAIITPWNLPSLLPWLDQLALTVLLEECDAMLARLEWPDHDRHSKQQHALTNENSKSTCQELGLVVQELTCVHLNGSVNQIAKRQQQPQESLHRKLQKQQRQPISTNVSQSNVRDLLLLARISFRAQLPLTRRMSLQRLVGYLQRQPHLFVEAVSRTNTEQILATAAATPLALDSLLELMKEAEAHHTLWPVLIQQSYLPSDLSLPEGNTGPEIVENPLFFFLLRQGLKQAAADRQNKQRQQEELAEAEGGNTCLRSPCVEDTDSDEEEEDVDTSDEEEDVNWQDSFTTWWTSWNNPQAHFIINDELSSLNRSPVVSGLGEPQKHQQHQRQRHRGQEQQQRSKDPKLQDRSTWLLSVWEKLLEPSIFEPPTTFEKPALVTPCLKGKRTFTC